MLSLPLVLRYTEIITAADLIIAYRRASLRFPARLFRIVHPFSMYANLLCIPITHAILG